MTYRSAIKTIAIAVTAVLAPQARATTLFSSTSGTQSALYSFTGQYGSKGAGDDFNTGYGQFYINDLKYYGGTTDPNLHLAIDFYTPQGVRELSVYPESQFFQGIGYHDLTTSTVWRDDPAANPIQGIGYIVFVPFYYGPGTPQFSLGYGAVPTTGANDPTFSVQTTDSPVVVSTGNYATNSSSGLINQYAQFELDGNPSDTSTSPLWAAAGSGNWTDSSSWILGVPNAVDSTANFVGGITVDSTVTLTSSQTVGTVDFNNPLHRYTIAGSSPLTLTTSTGPAIINSWSGSHTISCPIIYTNGLTVTTFADPSATSPALTLPLAITATGTLTKTGPGTLAFAASTSGITTLNLPAIAITAGTLSLSSNSSHNNRTLLLTSALSITGGRLDLGNNDLDLNGGGSAALSQLNGFAAQGFHNGDWNGSTGFSSSAAMSNTTHLTALGVIQNNQSGTAIYTASNKFDGTIPGAADILVKYTYYGDANLDGKVDGSDYSRIDNAYIADRSNPTAVTGWYNGDFNYDGAVNGSDYTLIDNAFNTQGASLALSLAVPSATVTTQIFESTAVPEPASLGLLGMYSINWLTRRKRNCCSQTC